MIYKTITALFLFACTITAGEPEWTKVESRFPDKTPKDWHEDVTWHRQTSFQNFDERMTYVHENTHLLDSDLSNDLTRKSLKNRIAFYVGKGKAMTIATPKLTKTQTKEFLPTALRGNRYNLYLVHKQPFRSPGGEFSSPDVTEDMAIGIVWEEWGAYVNGTQMLVHDEESGPKDAILKTDAAEACLEFCVYATATMQGMQKYDSDAFKDKQVRAVFAYQFRRAVKTYNHAMTFPRFRFHENHGAAFRGEDGKAMREFLAKEFGEEILTGVLPPGTTQP